MSEQIDVNKVIDGINNDPRVKINEDGTKTVSLGEPVQVRGETVSKVTFRRPKGRDWRETDKETGELAKGFRLAAALADLPMSVFDSMDGDDALLCATVAGTMGKKLPTGGM
jgi:hypothetical protein